jgi:hypothetical protein
MAAVRGHSGLLLIAVLVTAAGMGVVLTRQPLGVPGQGRWMQEPIRLNTPLVLVEPLLFAIALLVFVWWGLRKGVRNLFRKRFLTPFFGLLLVMSLGMAGPAGVGEPAYRVVFTSGLGSYLTEAEHIGPHSLIEGVVAPDPITYLRGFDRRVAEQSLETSAFRVAVHPPGMTLAVWAADYFWRGSEGRRVWGSRLAKGLHWPAVQTVFPADRPPPIREMTALTMVVFGAIVVAFTTLPMYALTYDLCGDGRAALGAAALWLTVPSVLLHAPSLDQLTPLLAVLLALTWFRACTRGRVGYAVLAGAVAWIGLFFTLAMATVGFALALTTLGSALWSRRGRKGDIPHFPPQAARRVLRRNEECPLFAPGLWVLIGAAAAAWLLLTALAWWLLDYNTVAVLYRVAQRNAEWNATVGQRPYWPWFLWNPLMFVLFFGGGATAVWLTGMRKQDDANQDEQDGRDREEQRRSDDKQDKSANARRPQPATHRPPSATPNHPVRPCSRPRVFGIPHTVFWWSIAVTMLVLWLSGQNRGETERLWSFWMALALSAGAAGLAGLRGLSTRTWLIVLVLNLALAFTLRYCIDVQKVLANIPKHVQTTGNSRT